MFQEIEELGAEQNDMIRAAHSCKCENNNLRPG